MPPCAPSAQPFDEAGLTAWQAFRTLALVRSHLDLEESLMLPLLQGRCLNLGGQVQVLRSLQSPT